MPSKNRKVRKITAYQKERSPLLTENIKKKVIRGQGWPAIRRESTKNREKRKGGLPLREGRDQPFLPPGKGKGEEAEKNLRPGRGRK